MRIVLKLAVALAFLCVTLLIMIGDIGFQGDDWWIFSRPFDNPFPYSILVYARDSLRPIEGAYWVTLFELLGFNKPAFHFLSLILLAADCTLMATALLNCFPERRSLAVMSGFFAFLMPVLSPLTFLIHTDNSRLSMMFFWSAVLVFQRWGIKSRSWAGLIPPILLYQLACMTYENCSLLIFAVPLFLLPILAKEELQTGPIIKLTAAVFVAFFLFIGLRFAVFSGGAVGHRSLIPSFELIGFYLRQFSEYMLVPFTSIEFGWGTLAWAATTAAIFAGLLWLAKDREAPRSRTWFLNPDFQIACMGLSVFCLGILPYIMAGYRPEIGFTSQSRVFSSAGFGAAILLGFVFSYPSRGIVYWVARAAAVAVIFVFAFFFADLRHDWQEAARIRDKLYSDFVKEVPDVKNGTVFLLLDFQCYIGKKAVIFQGVEGLKDWIKMIYGKKDLQAYYLYCPEEKQKIETLAKVGPEGIWARGRFDRPIPLDRILILKRDQSKMALVDRLTPGDNQAAIEWDGVREIKSNKDLIIQGFKDPAVCADPNIAKDKTLTEN
jgi:hypothetical protein